jgi:hypothetical protein|tara:strand:- start:704 stop:826 length:123 start_codon:yes stop_codon:yes gene_type:complete
MVAAIIAFSIANWPAGHPDGDEKNDHQLEEDHDRQLEKNL